MPHAESKHAVTPNRACEPAAGTELTWEALGRRARAEGSRTQGRSWRSERRQHSATDHRNLRRRWLLFDGQYRGMGADTERAIRGSERFVMVTRVKSVFQQAGQPRQEDDNP